MRRLGLCALLAAVACSWLPEASERPLSVARPPADEGRLVELERSLLAGHEPEDSAFLPVGANRDALRWRLTLVEQATASLDLQYFVWDEDASSDLLFLKLLEAAGRGVRVRLLLDDILLVGRDRMLAALSNQPDFEIRLFNPGRVRESTLGLVGEFLLNFRQLNRRMHNKLLVADNRFAIVGGRNVGDGYFGLSSDHNFRDLEVIAAGPVVREVSQAFDEYWNAELASPAAAIAPDASPEEIDPLRRRVMEEVEAESAKLAAVASLDLVRAGKEMSTGEAHFLQDAPVLVEGEPLRLLDMLRFVSRGLQEQLIVVSPYLIPGSDLLDAFAELGARGVEVKLLTASLASTNHTMVHAHYKKYRRRILETGAQLFEYRQQPSAAQREQADTPPVRARFVSLHTKLIVADREECYVGSLNIDPRAVDINTENGLYIESGVVCGLLADEALAMMAPANAWSVTRDERGRLRWRSDAGTRTRAPARSVGQRVADFLWRWIPIEGQL